MRPTSLTNDSRIPKASQIDLLRTLLPATYYNFYGWDHYNPLITQGGPGLGDKDTFIPAAEVMGEPYHRVSESAGGVGHFIEG